MEQNFGGPDTPEKAQWFVGAIEQYFQDNADLEWEEVEEMMISVLNSEFNVAEDDSVAEIAKEICKFYSLYKRDKHDVLRQKLAKLPRVDLSQCQAGNPPENQAQQRAKQEELGMTRMDLEDEKEEKVEVDPFEWQEVKSKKNRRKRIAPDGEEAATSNTTASSAQADGTMEQ